MFQSNLTDPQCDLHGQTLIYFQFAGPKKLYFIVKKNEPSFSTINYL